MSRGNVDKYLKFKGVIHMLPFPQLFVYDNKVITEPIFLMENFITTADIKDKSPNAIPITVNGSLPVGADSYGTYMNFTGLSTQWIEFKNALLDVGECRINLVMSNFQYRSNSQNYNNPIIDCRPYGTNGQYFYFDYRGGSPAPFSSNLIYNNTVVANTGTYNQYPVHFQIDIRSTGTQVYVNGDLKINVANTVNMVNQSFKIGRNAFINTAAVPLLYAKIYKFEIRKFK